MGHLRASLAALGFFTVLTGLAYPLAITALLHVVAPHEARGSLVVIDGKVVGSSLVGQAFTADHYLHGRPSAAGEQGYDPMRSGGSNLGPTSAALRDRVRAAVQTGGWSPPVPADAVTASASGLDPHVSPANALAQASRIAKARGLPEEKVRRLVANAVEAPTLGFLGEPRVNVLLFNLALDRGTGLR